MSGENRSPSLYQTSCYITSFLPHCEVALSASSQELWPPRSWSLAQNFLITGARCLAKEISKHCVPCQKAYARTKNQLMGQLSPDRATPSPPFSVTGLDFASPFTTLQGNHRKPTQVKTYICLFVCFSTKAVHLELCSDLSADTFINALRRFTARRGLPSHIYCDNGRNFVGAAKELTEVAHLKQSSDLQAQTSKITAESNIHWHFIPAWSPHFGGLWEAGVRLMKIQLRKLVRPHRLTYPQLNSIIAEVEATLNSRPLLPIEVDPQEGPQVITPGHFLIGRPLRSLPVKVDLTSNVSGLRRWNWTKRLSLDL